MKLFLPLIVALFSLSALAQQTIEFEGGVGMGNTDKPLTTAHVEYEVIETGDPLDPINWDATLGIMQAKEYTGNAILREQYDTYNVSEPVRGDAVFGVIGIQGRKFLVKDLIEATIRAEYGFRLHDNEPTYREFNDKGFDAYSGLNLSAGSAFILDKKYSIGGMLTRNMSSGTTTVRLTIGFKFNRRNDR